MLRIINKKLEIVDNIDTYVIYDSDNKTIPMAVIAKTDTEPYVKMQHPNNTYAVIGDIKAKHLNSCDHKIDTIMFADGTLETCTIGRDAKMLNPEQLNVTIDLSEININNADKEIINIVNGDVE